MSIAARLIIVIGLTAMIAHAAQGTADATQPVSVQQPREIYQGLNALRVDRAAIYPVSDLRLRRDAINLTLSDGTIGFLQAFDGRITGAVFSGHGRVSANLRDPAEKRSLAHFLGVPLLNQEFTSAYLRFDDDSTQEIQGQLHTSGANASTDDKFATSWDKALPNLNPDLSARLLMDWVADAPVPFFYAELLDERVGAFDVLVDGRRSDTVMVGQERWSAGIRYYDVWTSFPGSSVPAAPQPAFAPVSYTVDTKIENDRSLAGTTTIEVHAERAGERGIQLELSRFLKVQSAQDADGRALDFLQNDALSRPQIADRGNDLVLLFLPEKARAGQSYRIRISYRGSVISDAGNGVYFVGDRGSWYPHVAGMGHFATYDTTFHWPRRLRLVATGEKIEEHEEADQRVGHWRSDGRISIAGFNLGEYVIENVETVEGVKIQLAANSELENAIAERVSVPMIVGSQDPPPVRSNRRSPRPGPPPIVFTDNSPLIAGSPLKELGREIAGAIHFEQQWMGAFPFRQLVVSQAPGSIGQGFPELIYLPSLSFLPAVTQQRAGISDNTQETLNSIVPYHEVAHQWWGDLVGWDNYRDQWLTEGLANYIALAGADSEKPSAHLMAHWLDRYRKALTARQPGQEATADDAGPLSHGFRLNSSHDPDAYQKIIYGKGAWIFHMLRLMLQEPASKNPDERFIGLLRGLLEGHRYRALTTDDLQKAVERIMTPAMGIEGGRSMDWFFEQFVKSTGIPSYEVAYSVKPGAKGFVVWGKLIQSNVPDDFVLRVPIYGQAQAGKPALLGYVITSGEETPFQFASVVSPRKLLIDPQMTLLCSPASSASPSVENEPE
jgi:hypothetical protein